MTLIKPNELELSAEYWVNAGDHHLLCDSWAIDDEDYEQWEGPKLVYVGALGPPTSLQQTARTIRVQRTKVHITSSDPARWHTSLDVSALRNSRIFRTPLPDVKLHHMTLMPTDDWYAAQNSLAPHKDDLPIYLFPESEELLPKTLGNTMRRLTTLLCPPQWDEPLLQICRRLNVIKVLDGHGVSAWRLMPQVDEVQEAIRKAVNQGSLRL